MAISGLKLKPRTLALTQDRPKEPDVVEGADQGRFSRIIDGPMCMKTKTQAFLTDSVNRMLGH